MNVTCPNCATVYRVDPAKVPEAGVRARCAVCSAVFAVSRETRVSSPAAAGPAATPPLTSAPAAPTPPAPTLSGPTAPTSAAPVPSAPPPSPAVAAGTPVAPTRPAGPPAIPARPGAPPAAGSGAALPPRPAAPVQAQRPASPPPTRAPAPAPSVPATPPPPPAAPPPVAARPTATAGPGGRPVNPFLSQDPSLKARRLARALVSDIVVYHPAKRQEGIRDGNLRELFEEEIKKSWEEYTEQVGREVAESTGYFREALNEILAGGRQIF